MRINDRIKRTIAFYLSVLLFLILLPVLLSFSLGYKIDLKGLKIYKTGIIYVNSNPSGAYVYINGKLHANLTPAQIEELRPGTYNIEVKREGFYPWDMELVVRPNMVTKAEDIVLFPITKGLKEISKYGISDFAVSDKNHVYYFTKHGLLMSDMDGNDLRELADYSDWPINIIDKKFSPDGNKLLYFNVRKIYVIYLNLDETQVSNGQSADVEEVFISDEPIVKVFWHSGSSYIIAVTRKDIRAVELRGADKRNIVTLYKFIARPASLYYDEGNDSLYFADGRLYRLDLRQKFFDTLMKLLLKKETQGVHGKKQIL